MESFFLGETAKYLYLLFTEDHPLNKGRGGENVVFTTEGHPLIIPRNVRKAGARTHMKQNSEQQLTAPPPQCIAPPKALPFTISNVANRHDLFHAAALTHLHLVPVNPTRSSPLVEASQHGPSISFADVRSPTNYTFYPWTLPQDLIPEKGITSVVWSPVISTLTFPDLSAINAGDSTTSAKGSLPAVPLGALQKVLDGILIHSLSNVRLSMVQEPRSILMPSTEDGNTMVEMEAGHEFRVQGIANWMLGRDEKVLITGKALEGVSPMDPHFTRKRDLEWVDLVLDLPSHQKQYNQEHGVELNPFLTAHLFQSGAFNKSINEVWESIEGIFHDAGFDLTRPGEAKFDIFSKAWSRLTEKASSTATVEPSEPTLTRTLLPAILPTGAGAAPLPPALESADVSSLALGALPLRKVFFMDSTLCTHQLPPPIAKDYQILIIWRGGCSFNEKLANIPSIPSSSDGLQLIIVLDDHDGSDANTAQLIRPLLDTVQKTPSGLERRHPIAMVMVDGRQETREVLWRIVSAVGTGFAEGQAKVNDLTKGQATDSKSLISGMGMTVKRRYWFESMGVPIANLIVL
jgi:hypothetical protein